jgi:poly(hydroxyalkanoate) depolymerase family esterase
MARLAMRSGAKAIKLAMKTARKPRKPRVIKAKAVRPVAAKRAAGRIARTPVRAITAKPASLLARTAATQWTTGMASGVGGARRYRLFTPSGLQSHESMPLVVMLHGCAQDAEDLAASSQMNRLAQRERFLVLYPEQDRLANMQNCWNWYDTRSGRAQREADSIALAVNHVCQTHAVDPSCVALVGLSAGAGMAGLLAVRQPERFEAVVMHSGVGPGLARSSASALAAMGGRSLAVPLAALEAGLHLPALLVIQGSADPIVAPSNGAHVAQLWADREGARAGKPRTLQRGKRYPALVTDYRNRGRLVATLCLVQGLGHAWSGGAPGLAYSDPQGPDASRMAWAFIKKQFANSASLSQATQRGTLRTARLAQA